MEDVMIQLFGAYNVTLSIWVLIACVFVAFVFGIRVCWLLTKETRILTQRFNKNEKQDIAQQQAIDELKRAVAALEDESKTQDARVSAVNILLTSTTAKRVL